LRPKPRRSARKRPKRLKALAETDEAAAAQAGVSPGNETAEGANAADKLANEIIAAAAAVTGSN
jgi:hypothetical protein